MTIDEERLQAINATREYLMEKIKGRTKLRNRKERVRVFNLLRRFPEEHWVDDVGSILKLIEDKSVAFWLTNILGHLSDTDKMQRLTRELASRCGLQVMEKEKR